MAQVVSGQFDGLGERGGQGPRQVSGGAHLRGAGDDGHDRAVRRRTAA
jgi:hypothetical protein